MNTAVTVSNSNYQCISGSKNCLTFNTARPIPLSTYIVVEHGNCKTTLWAAELWKKQCRVKNISFEVQCIDLKP